MKRPSYRAAIQWLVENDDCDWLAGNPGDSISVSAALIADLFEVERPKLIADLVRAHKKLLTEGNS